MTTTPDTVDVSPDASASAAAAAPQPSLVTRALAVLTREPVLFVTLGYVFVAFIGLWANYWFYRRFGIPILEYMQGSDYLVAGLRNPAYAGVLVMAVLASLLITWPERWRRRYPQRTAQLRQRWWGKAIFPGTNKWYRWWGMSPETGVVFGVVWIMIWGVYAQVVQNAVAIQRGGGHRVRVTLAGQKAPMPGMPRLLGTSSAFIYLYWPVGKRAEVVPIEAVGRIESLRKPRTP